MVDCHHCCRQITGTPHKGVSGSFLCDSCYGASTKCSKCRRAAPPHYLHGDGTCGSCHKD